MAARRRRSPETLTYMRVIEKKGLPTCGLGDGGKLNPNKLVAPTFNRGGVGKQSVQRAIVYGQLLNTLLSFFVTGDGKTVAELCRIRMQRNLYFSDFLI